MGSGTPPEDWYKRVKNALLDSAVKCAELTEQWAIKNHEWENVTGEAEKHLTGYVIDTDSKIGFGVAQGVPYGKYLETAFDGKYAVCEKAIDHVKPDFDALVKRIGGGR